MTKPHQLPIESSTSHSSNGDSSNGDAVEPSWDRQCMLYLLGELPADQAAELEQRLAVSPQLGKELLRQADLIAAISLVRSEPAVPLVSRDPVLRWPIVASMMAIAACIALVVLVGQLGTPEGQRLAGLGELPTHAGSSEELLIARAWADSRLNVATDDFIDFELDDAVAITSEDSSDVDSTLSWMFIAVSGSIDSHSAEATNDG